MDNFLDGWLAWDKTLTVYRAPDNTKGTFEPWDPACQAAIEALREMACDKAYWKKLAVYFSEENHELAMTQDNVSCVKSICEYSSLWCNVVAQSVLPVQVLGDAPLSALRPIIEELMADKDQDKQRAAAELLAGILGGLWLVYSHFMTMTIDRRL